MRTIGKSELVAHTDQEFPYVCNARPRAGSKIVQPGYRARRVKETLPHGGDDEDGSGHGYIKSDLPKQGAVTAPVHLVSGAT